MTVIDASVAIDALAASTSAGDRARAEIERHAHVHTPSHFVAEVCSGLRSMVARGEADEQDVGVLMARALALSRAVHPIDPLLARAWELRHVVSVYDGWYVALAEALDEDLVTNDRRLQRAPGIRCTVRPPAAD